MADEQVPAVPAVTSIPVVPAEPVEPHSPWTPHNRRVATLVLVGLGVSTVAALDLIGWYTGTGPQGEMPFAAAERGPGGMTPALICLFILTFFLSRRDAWALLVLPVIAHAVLDIWQAGAAYSLTMDSYVTGALARELARAHAWVDGTTIVLGLALVIVALAFETHHPKPWSPAH